MIISNSSKISIEILLAGAVTANQLQCTAIWTDLPSSDFASGINTTVTNDATAVTLVSAVTTTYRREIKYIDIFNADTASATVTIRINNNGSFTILQKIVLPSGYHLVYNSGTGWQVLSTSGAVVGTTTNILPDGTYGEIVVTSSGTVMTLLASINKDITGIWSFVYDKLRLYDAAQNFYHAFRSLASANRTITIPDKDLTVAGIDDVITLLAQHVTNGAFADSTTYYAGIGGLFVTTDTAVDAAAPFDCTVIGLIVTCANNTTSGTTENVVMKVRNTTDTSSSASFGNIQTNASTSNALQFYLTGTTFDLDSGDLYCMQLETPAWVTNPIGCIIRIIPVVKRR